MAIISRAQLKKWFSRGKYPTEGQFAAWIDGFFHKEEDTIPMSSVGGLTDQLNGKYDNESGKVLEKDMANVKADITSLKGDVTDMIDDVNNQLSSVNTSLSLLQQLVDNNASILPNVIIEAFNELEGNYDTFKEVLNVYEHDGLEVGDTYSHGYLELKAITDLMDDELNIINNEITQYPDLQESFQPLLAQIQAAITSARDAIDEQWQSVASEVSTIWYSFEREGYTIKVLTTEHDPNATSKRLLTALTADILDRYVYISNTPATYDTTSANINGGVDLNKYPGSPLVVEEGEAAMFFFNNRIDEWEKVVLNKSGVDLSSPVGKEITTEEELLAIPMDSDNTEFVVTKNITTSNVLDFTPRTLDGYIKITIAKNSTLTLGGLIGAANNLSFKGSGNSQLIINGSTNCLSQHWMTFSKLKVSTNISGDRYRFSLCHGSNIFITSANQLKVDRTNHLTLNDTNNGGTTATVSAYVEIENSRLDTSSLYVAYLKLHACNMTDATQIGKFNANDLIVDKWVSTGFNTFISKGVASFTNCYGFSDTVQLSWWNGGGDGGACTNASFVNCSFNGAEVHADQKQSIANIVFERCKFFWKGTKTYSAALYAYQSNFIFKECWLQVNGGTAPIKYVADPVNGVQVDGDVLIFDHTQFLGDTFTDDVVNSTGVMELAYINGCEFINGATVEIPNRLGLTKLSIEDCSGITANIVTTNATKNLATFEVYNCTWSGISTLYLPYTATFVSKNCKKDAGASVQIYPIEPLSPTKVAKACIQDVDNNIYGIADGGGAANNPNYTQLLSPETLALGNSNGSIVVQPDGTWEVINNEWVKHEKNTEPFISPTINIFVKKVGRNSDGYARALLTFDLRDIPADLIATAMIVTTTTKGISEQRIMVQPSLSDIEILMPTALVDGDTVTVNITANPSSVGKNIYLGNSVSFVFKDVEY